MQHVSTYNSHLHAKQEPLMLYRVVVRVWDPIWLKQRAETDRSASGQNKKKKPTTLLTPTESYKAEEQRPTSSFAQATYFTLHTIA